MTRTPAAALDELADTLSGALTREKPEPTLRDASQGDPPKGCPMLVDGEPIDPGQWRWNGLADPRTGLPVQCPVRPLGKVGDEFYFLNTVGEVHVLTASSSGKGPIDALFAGRSGYLDWAWPRFGASSKEDGKPSVKGYEADEARKCLFDACAFKGVFDDQDKVRGRGAWRDDDGTLIYHAGDKVFIGGEWQAPGEIGRAVYPARPRLARPWPKPEPGGIGSAGDLVLEVLRTWQWERGELDARLMLGWIMTAWVGGALKVRPAVYLSGQEGSGKSSLQELIRGGSSCGHTGILQGACVSTSNSTQAGIYQKVNQDSVAVSIDENETEADARGADKLIKLARIAYSGDQMLRGGAEHSGKSFTVMSPFLFSSIAEPAMDAQDATRMAKLVLREIEHVRAASPYEKIEPFQEAGRKLLRRWFDHWRDWPTVLLIFRSMLIEAGHDSRAADTFGTLAAASWLAIEDGLPGEEELKPWKAWLDPAKLVETSDRQKTWRRCFKFMLDAQPEAYKGLTRRSVGEYLAAFRENAAFVEDCYSRLPHVGLALSFAKGDAETWEHARLFVPATHPGLTALFQGTQWAGRLGAPGPWMGVLRQAPRGYWKVGKCGKGLDGKAHGLLISVKDALEDL